MNQIAIFTQNSLDFDQMEYMDAAEAVEQAVNNFIKDSGDDILVVNVQFSTVAVSRGKSPYVVYTALLWYDMPRKK